MGVFVAGPLNSSDVVKGDDWGIHLNDSSKDGYVNVTTLETTTAVALSW